MPDNGLSEDTNRAAVLESAQARLTTKARPVPRPGDNEVLVRNHAIASNPIDWMMQDYNIFIANYPTVLGSDISGTVTAVGSSVTGIAPGDRVFGFAAVIGNSNIDHGAFQTYTILNDFATTQLPTTVSFERGSTLPMAAATAALGLFVNLEIPRPGSSSSSPVGAQATAILVWGGASSVGSLVIQMAKKLGLVVIATASPIHHTYIKSLGATAVIDYKDAGVVRKIANAAEEAGGCFKYAYDCVSKGETFSQCTQVLFGSSAGPSSRENELRLVLTLPWPEALSKPEGIAISQVIVLELEAKHKELSRWLFHEWLPTALTDGSIVPSPPIEIVPGGLEATQAMWDKQKAGVSGTKLVLQVH